MLIEKGWMQHSRESSGERLNCSIPLPGQAQPQPDCRRFCMQRLARSIFTAEGVLEGSTTLLRGEKACFAIRCVLPSLIPPTFLGTSTRYMYYAEVSCHVSSHEASSSSSCPESSRSAGHCSRQVLVAIFVSATVQYRSTVLASGHDENLPSIAYTFLSRNDHLAPSVCTSSCFGKPSVVF